MNKYSLDDVVKFQERPGLFTIVELDTGESGFFYKIVLKNQYDKLDLEDEKIPFEDLVIYSDVPESQLFSVFS